MPRVTALAHQKYASTLSQSQQTARSDRLLAFYDQLPPRLQTYVRDLTGQISSQLMDQRAQITGREQAVAQWGILSTLELLNEIYNFLEGKEIIP